MRLVAARWAHFLLLCLSTLSSLSAAANINQTIDDLQTGSQAPAFAPSGDWATGQTCTTCALHPGIVNVSQAFDGTWHDSTYHPGSPPGEITATFTGTAVYVFNIIANNFGGITTFTNLTFYIDNELVGSYIHTPTSDANILYRVPVYTNTSLANQEHFLRIVNGGGPDASLILFDFIAYTTEDLPSNTTSTTKELASRATSDTVSGTPSNSAVSSQSTSSSSPPIGAIVGGVVGGVGGLVLVGLAVLFCRRRSPSTDPEDLANKIEPFTGSRIGESNITRRASRAPVLPSLRFGRSRLGPGSSVSGSTASEYRTLPYQPLPFKPPHSPYYRPTFTPWRRC